MSLRTRNGVDGSNWNNVFSYALIIRFTMFLFVLSVFTFSILHFSINTSVFIIKNGEELFDAVNGDTNTSPSQTRNDSLTATQDSMSLESSFWFENSSEGKIVSFSGPPRLFGGGEDYPYSGSGDWVIDSDTFVENEVIVVNGNLFVQNDGNLTLTNVTLQMNCTYDGQFCIRVNSGGSLNIHSHSAVTAVNASHAWYLKASSGTNIVFNGSSFSYAGWEETTSGDHSGLWINSAGVKITHCSIQSNFRGIYFSDADDVIISHNSINNSLDGVLFDGSCSDNNVSCNVFTHCVTGIHFETSSQSQSGNIVTNNNITCCTGSGIYLNGQTGGSCFNFAIINNTIDRVGDYGIGMHFNSYNNILHNNSVFSSENHAIYLRGTHDINVTENRIFDSFMDGINLLESDNCIISGNILFNFSNPYRGIYLDSCNYSFILGNFISNGSVASVGVCLNSSHHSFIVGNSISDSLGTAMFLKSSRNVTVSENEILRNGENGIYLDSNATLNCIYLNSFQDNFIQALDYNGTNLWDNGSHGNWWSDYTGSDTDFDGIGDTEEYMILGSAVSDRFPLMLPFGFDTDPPSIDYPDSFSFEMGTTGHNITWIPSDVHPAGYSILINMSLINTTRWNGSNIVINVDNLSLGIHNVTVVVYDLAGNWVTDSVWVTVVDTTPPIISLTSLSNGSAVESDDYISLTIFDPNLDTILYNWDSVSNQTLGFPHNIPVLTSEGLHHLYVYVNDTLGQVTISHFSFKVDDSNPLISSFSTTNGTSGLPGSWVSFNVSDFTLSSVMVSWDNESYSSVTFDDLVRVEIPQEVGTHILHIVAADELLHETSVFFVFIVECSLSCDSILFPRIMYEGDSKEFSIRICNSANVSLNLGWNIIAPADSISIDHQEIFSVPANGFYWFNFTVRPNHASFHNVTVIFYSGETPVIPQPFIFEVYPFFLNPAFFVPTLFIFFGVLFIVVTVILITFVTLRFKLWERGIGVTRKPMVTSKKAIKVPPAEQSTISIPIPHLTPRDLDDLFCVDQILCIQRDSGLNFFQREVSIHKIDSQLISGYLIAMRALVQQISSRPPLRGRQAFKEISDDEGNFIINSVEGEISVTSVMLNRKPSPAFKKRLKEFNSFLEQQFEYELNKPLLDARDFSNLDDLFDQELGTYFLYPMRLYRTETRYKEPLNTIVDFSEDKQRVFQAGEGFYIEEIVTELLRKYNFTYDKLLAAIIQLVEDGVLRPVSSLSTP